MAQTHHTSVLRYDLAPDSDARQALEETFAAYATMFSMLDELASEKAGANLVTLHELAYETVRDCTGLPARLVTLGLRDFASNRSRVWAAERLPLDDKLFAIKGPADLTIATVRGRVAVPYDVAGYSRGTLNIFNAQLVAHGGRYQIHIGVNPHADRTEEHLMTSESILSRMGRLIASLANSVIDKAEDTNRVAIVEQALREIDAAADEARTDIGKARAEEYRILTRRNEIGSDMAMLEDKIGTAISAGRDDLAKAGVARQIDLESQLAALDKALADVRVNLDEGQQALQAVLATRREAEQRLAELKRSLERFPEGRAPGKKRNPADGAARAASAISRVTGVPSGTGDGSVELDELDRLHRERAIEARLAQFKTRQK
ncbi:PspA/IM30 family protein [Neorhizobium sp. BETTINA12A]|uniref:PspA/IM30 family protein n=1 Tax=Neorhizobium sp. BETTINA12A TaxID=2908924 RepID=UPI001FF3E92E|nr:PspA/IM30 family protein [Neorhizobium sp. BETTINA12A]MCJ9751202.1 PspA/IM30 family protein [Neorhizobium sp. BETTINA12A]